MCTVVFIPGNINNYFASLRDESPIRQTALIPEVYKSKRGKYLAPIDPMAGGTWLGVNEFQNVIILLNGAFENHKRKKNYLKSRGLIVLELLSSTMPVVDWYLMELLEIEPFTLVVWSENNLFELVWDGVNKHRKRLDTMVPHIWSSSTLYNEEAKCKRKKLFHDWVNTNPIISKLSLLNFFKSNQDSKNGFLINRDELLKTLSFSFIELTQNNSAIFNYQDLTNNISGIKVFDFLNNSDSCSLENYYLSLP